MATSIVIACENHPRAARYVEALKAAGAAASDLIVVTPRDTPAPDLEALGARARGLLICGGEDLEPWRYGEKPLTGIDLDLAPALDELEWGLLTSAQARQTPVWGICRGCQTINVFLGGSLWQDIPRQHASRVEHNLPQPHEAIAHQVEAVVTDEAFAAMIGRQRIGVNSRHHQAIRRLGHGLVSIAQAPDGIIEAIGLPGTNPWWVRAVQWHPEDLASRPLEVSLWRDFVLATDACGKTLDTNLRRRAG